jgi:hypothetical protein
VASGRQLSCGILPHIPTMSLWLQVLIEQGLGSDSVEVQVHLAHSPAVAYRQA